MVKENTNKSKKKELRQEVTHQLEQALGKLKEHLGEKKYQARIKKAVKILTENLGSFETEKAAKKKAAPVKEQKAAKAEPAPAETKPAPKKTNSATAAKKSAPKKAAKKISE